MQLRMIASVKTVEYATKIRLHKRIKTFTYAKIIVYICVGVTKYKMYVSDTIPSAQWDPQVCTFYIFEIFLYIFLRASAQKSDWCSEANCRRMGHMYIHTYTRKDEQSYL